MPNWPEYRLDLLREHRSVLEAIAEGDAKQAAALMEAHIRDAYAALGIGQSPES